MCTCHFTVVFFFTCFKVKTGSVQARRKPQRGPGKHSRGASKHFHGAPLGRKFLNFSFQNGTFWRTFYFSPTAGPSKRRGARGS